MYIVWNPLRKGDRGFLLAAESLDDSLTQAIPRLLEKKYIAIEDINNLKSKYIGETRIFNFFKETPGYEPSLDMEALDDGELVPVDLGRFFD